MAERRLTVSTLREPRPTTRYLQPGKPERVVPFLRLRGAWLSELGFEAGVRVETSPGRLVLTAAPAEPATEAGAGDG